MAIKTVLTKFNRVEIIKKVIDIFDPIGLIELGSPSDEYFQEATMIEYMLSQRNNYIGLNKEIQEVFLRQFDYLVTMKIIRKIRIMIVVDIDRHEFLKEFNDIEELKGRVAFNEGNISMTIHDNFIVSTIGITTYINDKLYYLIDEQDLIDSYSEFVLNEDYIYIQYKRKYFKLSFDSMLRSFIVIKKRKFSLEKMKHKKNIEMIFDNKRTILDNREK